MKGPMRDEDKILLLTARAAVNPGEPSGGEPSGLVRLLAPPLDWQYLVREASLQGMLPLLLRLLEKEELLGQIPQPHRWQLIASQAAALQHSFFLSLDLKKVLDGFSRAGIPAIPIKGLILAEALYGDVSLRPTSDLDILVRPQDLDRARGLLPGLGYRASFWQQNLSHPFHDPPYISNRPGVFLELHWSLYPDLRDTNMHDVIWQRAQPVLWNGHRVLVLSPEDNLLYLSWHLPRHGGILKLFCDITLLAKKYEDEFDWRHLLWAAERFRARPALHFTLSRARRFLGCPVPEGILQETKPGAIRHWLIELLWGGEAFATPPKKDPRVTSETVGLVCCLMCSDIRGIVAAYLRHVCSGRRWARAKRSWQRTGVILSGMALGLYSLGFCLAHHLKQRFALFAEGRK